MSRKWTPLESAESRELTESEEDLADEWSVPGEGPHVLLLDHRDSFTYNLVQSLSRSGARITVRQADQRSLADLKALNPDRLLLSPGPGKPETAILAQQAFHFWRGQRPILGVCLGHQVIARCMGAQVIPSGAPVHGKPDQIRHCTTGIFDGLPNPLTVARYHSLHVVPDSLPAEVAVTAWSDRGGIMGLALPGEATWGVQFHPESFLTPEGDQLLKAFVDGCPCPEYLGESLLPESVAAAVATSQSVPLKGETR